MSLLYAFVAPGVLAAAAVWWQRRRHLDRWDLRKSPTAPPAAKLVWLFLGVFVVSGLLLSLALSGAEGCAPEQRNMNILYTWGGILLVTLLCLFGLLVVNRLYARR